MKNTKVNIYGLGYIGLPTAALIAKNRFQVLGIDINQDVVHTINKGKIHIVEPDLQGLVKVVVEAKMLQASETPEIADVHIIAVPTPFKEDHSPDISFVINACLAAIPVLKEQDLFILESTSPIGTTKKLEQLIFSKRPELKDKIYIAYCPERVLPGNIIYELENNDRIIGGINDASSEKAINFYRNFVKSTLHKTNARTAEMCKLVENSSRDVQIAFANELSIIAEKANINVWELINLANKHPRVNILQPGTGVGGHCIAVDPWFIIKEFEEDSKLIATARKRNTEKTEWVINKINTEINTFKTKHNKTPILGIMGLAFKPNIDDLRESPALYVARQMKNSFSEIIVNEPNILKHSEFTLNSADEIIKSADILVFLVLHKEYQGLEIPKNKIVLDFCGFNKKI